MGKRELILMVNQTFALFVIHMGIFVAQVAFRYSLFAALYCQVCTSLSKIYGGHWG
jgi:hypothetical protein